MWSSSGDTALSTVEAAFEVVQLAEAFN